MERTRSFNYSVLTYFMIVLAFVVLRLLSSFGLFNFLGEYGEYVLTLVIQVGLLFCGPMLVYPAFKKQKFATTKSEFCIKKPSGTVVWLSILLGVVVYFLNMFVADAFHGLIEFFGYEHASTGISSYSFGTLVLNIIFTAFLPAICEEIAHRGMLLRSFSPLGTAKAIVLSALLFGLLHLNIEQFFYATIIGLFLGYLTVICNSIVPAMIVHFMNNALGTYILFSRVNGLPLGRIVNYFSAVMSSSLFLGIVLSVLFILILVYAGMWLTRTIAFKRIREDIDLMQKQFQREMIREAYLADLESVKTGAPSSKLEEQIESLKQFIINPDDELPQDDFRPSKYAKMLLYVTLALGGVLTIFTFVWGVL